jgi:hypothetical protein
LIRFANKYDNDKIIELIKEFAIKIETPLASNPLSWSKTHCEHILTMLYAGLGFVLIDNEQTGILIAIKSKYIWNNNIIQLQEIMLTGKTNIVTARLIKEYIKTGKEMLEKKEINQVVMSSYPNIDLSKFGFKLLEHHWEIN